MLKRSIAVVTGLGAIVATVLPASPASAATPVGWKTFSSAAGGFSAAMPVKAYGKFVMSKDKVPFSDTVTAEFYDVGTAGNYSVPVGVGGFVFPKATTSVSGAPVLAVLADLPSVGDPTIKVRSWAETTYGPHHWPAYKLAITDHYKKKAVAATLLVVESPKHKKYWLIEAPTALWATMLAHLTLKS